MSVLGALEQEAEDARVLRKAARGKILLNQLPSGSGCV